jgi:curli biogenesis system outer membrane secretion channel CsgG
MDIKNIKIILAFVIIYLTIGSTSFVFAAEKPLIGVLRFTNHTHAYWWSPGTAAELQDMLIKELTAAKSFQVLERQSLTAILCEQKLYDQALAEVKTKLKAGKIRGVKYLVAAIVTAFEENTGSGVDGINLRNLSFGEEEQKAYLAIDLKIIDGESGAVIDIRSIEVTSAGGGKQNGRQGNDSGLSVSLIKQENTLVGKAIRSSINEIAAYLQCSLITKNEECINKFPAKETKRKAKNKAVIQEE